VAERPAINTSPLVYLARARRLELLRLVRERIVVPEAVAREIRAFDRPDAAVQAINAVSWLDIVSTPMPSATVMAWDLGEGESAVLAWGETHTGTELIIDDLAARRCAATLGIPVRGTLGLVLLAKARGAISEARPVLEELLRAGMYLSQRVIADALRRIGE